MQQGAAYIFGECRTNFCVFCMQNVSSVASNSTMKGISQAKAGGAENLKYDEVPMPEMNEGQVMIEVHATALNGADLLQRAGNYPAPPGKHSIP